MIGGKHPTHMNGLERLITANHEENLRRFDDLKELINSQAKRITKVETIICEHDVILGRIKVVGTLVALAWAGIVAFVVKVWK